MTLLELCCLVRLCLCNAIPILTSLYWGRKIVTLQHPFLLKFPFLLHSRLRPPYGTPDLCAWSLGYTSLIHWRALMCPARSRRSQNQGALLIHDHSLNPSTCSFIPDIRRTDKWSPQHQTERFVYKCPRTPHVCGRSSCCLTRPYLPIPRTASATPPTAVHQSYFQYARRTSRLRQKLQILLDGT